ncbi:metallo-beta-lactamase class B [Maribacter sedimenticola]|uniref:Metallo-beta-lactamase class B n=1 Tax=Maribacter sedimenticola TaxID=228956 RepID=A0ABY1SHQ8_9FLAO|nr:MBL fold metallo-hydrolase [Maribacter sedimenticola]SNR54919.1 metallo-beta-lactamase class B [Maribacter sedimenticola]
MKQIIFLLSIVFIFGCNSKKQQADNPPNTSSKLKDNKDEIPEGMRNSPLFDTTVVTPTQLFDNIYYVGYKGVGSFVVTTSEGIILIDAMWTSNDAETVIVPRIKELGLDPNSIKKLIVTHEHADHYGGARYLEKNYNAKVMMSKVAWEGLHDPNARVLVDPFGNKSSDLSVPKNYMELTDKQLVTLGNTSIQILLTPGHTQGAISMIIPTTDHGEPHVVAIWGGTGLPDTLEENKTYLNSLNYFASQAVTQNVDAQISNHPFSNDLLDKMTALRSRNPNDTNPIIVGTESFSTTIDTTLRKNVQEKIELLKKKDQ